MLYITATPIGSLDEITLRALNVLKSVSVIAAEDTRRTSTLLNHYGIKTPLIEYQKFNESAAAQGIIGRLKNGEDVALVSDAGMPLISDPGQILINECVKNNVEYTVVSGASALINAVVLSGLSTLEFTFIGFLPDKKKLREQKIAPYIHVPSTLIFYAPPQSVSKDLDFLFKSLGKRKFSIVREISKKFEQVVHGELGSAVSITIKGEFVIVVEGYRKEASSMSVKDIFNEYICLGVERMEAMKRTALDKGISKSEVYKYVVDKNEPLL